MPVLPRHLGTALSWLLLTLAPAGGLAQPAARDPASAAREPSPGRVARGRDHGLVLAPAPLPGGGAMLMRGDF
ncbi:MAG: hypothetical protein HY906_04550 [Deltaproteobacteria bacterium]|nr:hypothetical protein [Deltaproteobacteria bacterium]